MSSESHILSSAHRASAVLPNPQALPHEMQETLWLQAFRSGRVAALFACVVWLPIILVVDPRMSSASLATFVSVLASAAVGLAALALHLPAVLTASTVLLLGLSGISVVAGAASPVVSGAVVMTLLIELLLMPGHIRRSGMIVGALLVPVLMLGGKDFFGATLEWSYATAPVAMLVPVGALVTLFQNMGAYRRHLDATTQSNDDSRVEDIMLKASDVAMAMLEKDGHIARASMAFSETLGEAGEMTDRDLFDRILIAERPMFLKAVYEAAIDGRSASLCLHLRTNAQGGDRPAPAEIKAFEVELRSAGAASQRATLRLTRKPVPQPSDKPVVFTPDLQLIKAITHETRTPMNTVIGFSTLLADRALAEKAPGEAADYARLITRAAREQMAVTSALVELLRPESDILSETEKFDLVDLARAVAGGLKRQGDHLPEIAVRGVGMEINGDFSRTRMLLTALIEAFATSAAAAAAVSCEISAEGSVACINIMTRSATPDASSASVGVAMALANRITARLGGKAALFSSGQILHAHLELPRDLDPRSVLAGSIQPPEDSSVMPMRKSA